ncbi:unnamed protein product [Blumeria hordei]|uniref:Uncharacterized protein n=1 Tax=Blumeria hordei TaxID=2867405 RepID=A0A383UT45_BLUHO|nr:unnamed protein product [Blumeria hordei]
MAKDSELAKLAETWTQIAQGENTAQEVEAKLTSLENKIDVLLANFEASQQLLIDARVDPAPSCQKEEKASRE